MEKCSKRRFYAPDLAVGRITLSADESRHACSVLRLKEGDSAALFDGEGGLGSGTIISCDKRSTIVEVNDISRDPAAAVGIHLAIAVPKAKRMDYLAEKAAELGVASLQPVRFERSVAGGEEFSKSRQEKCIRSFISAAKQCSLNRLPELRPIVKLDDLAVSLNNSPAVFGYLGGGVVTVAQAIDSFRPPCDVTIVVGPEGGIADSERELLLEAGAVPVRLGSTIFRVETAGVALVSAVRAIFDHKEETF